MYALIDNGQVAAYPYSLTDLKRAYPTTSFPANPTDASLEPLNVFRVFASTQPEYDPMAQVAEEGTPVFDSQDSRWTQTWRVRDFTPEEIAARDDAQAAAVRAERNQKLAASDWTQVIDAPVDQTAWAQYRQALRDLSAQPGFPWQIDWPEPPAN